MATIVTRAGKGSPLTNNEMDDNLTNLNTDKVETSVLANYALIASPTFTGDPKAPNPSFGDNDTSIATTSFVNSNAVIKTATTGGANIPVGTTAQRPTGSDGIFRYNTNLAGFEGYSGSSWVTFSEDDPLVQIGISGTPANNFTLDASADDGTMKLARGNAGVPTQDVMTVAADGTVAFPQNAPLLQTATMQATTSGSTKDFTIPAGVKLIMLSLIGVSTNGGANLGVQLGDAGGVEATGYVGEVSTSVSGDSSAFSTSFLTQAVGNASYSRSGIVTLALVDSATNLWSCAFTIGNTVGVVNFGGGYKALSQELTTVRLVTTDTFDAGNINVLYQG